MSGREIPIAMLPNLEDAAPRYAFLLRVTPIKPDLSVLGITTWDVDIEYGDSDDGITYHARRGYDSQANEATADLAVDNSEARFLVSEDYFDGITADAISRGDYDGASFVQYMVNPYDLSEGHIIVTTGTCGRITNIDGLEGTLELRSLTQTLKQKSIIELGSNNCRVVEFGDERCGVDVGALWVNASVESVGAETDREFYIAGSDLDETDGAYWPGLFEFEAGDNAGRSYEIESYTATSDGLRVVLAIPTELPIQDTDYGRIRPDCTRLWEGPNSCETYSNRPNFRGEPKRPVSETTALMASGAGSPSSGGDTIDESATA